MVKSGQIPDVNSYEKLKSILDVKATTTNRKDKSVILGIINSKMGMVKAKQKGKKDEFLKFKKRSPRIQDLLVMPSNGMLFFWNFIIRKLS